MSVSSKRLLPHDFPILFIYETIGSPDCSLTYENIVTVHGHLEFDISFGNPCRVWNIEEYLWLLLYCRTERRVTEVEKWLSISRSLDI